MVRGELNKADLVGYSGKTILWASKGALISYMLVNFLVSLKVTSTLLSTQKTEKRFCFRDKPACFVAVAERICPAPFGYVLFNLAAATRVDSFFSLGVCVPRGNFEDEFAGRLFGKARFLSLCVPVLFLFCLCW
jgi:hypothetical protein